MKLRKAAAMAAGLLMLGTSSSPAQQLNLPPDVLGALVELYQYSVYYCQNGLQVSCQTAQAIDQQAGMMSHAFTVCQQGDQQACAWYQNGVMQVSMAYQQTFAGGAMGGGGGGQPFDTTAMTMQHQQNMNNLQQQFNAGQQAYQQQQQLNDQMFNNYLNTIRN